MDKNKVLPAGWAEAKLGEICSIKTGDKDVNEGSLNGEYPFFTCSKDIYRFATYSFDGKAILVAGNGNFNIKKYCGKFEAYQRTYVLQNFSADYDYLYYYLSGNLDELTKDNRGSTVRYIRIGNLTEFNVRIPPINEQYHIVERLEELFSELDAGVKALKTAQEQLKVYRQAVLKDAFEGKLTIEWQGESAQVFKDEKTLLSFIQEEHERIYDERLKLWEKESYKVEKGSYSFSEKPKNINKAISPNYEEMEKLTKLPKGWAYVYLDALGDLGRGKSKHRPRNDLKLFDGGIYPFVQTGEIKKANKFIKTHLTAYNEFGLKQSKLWPVGTLCITIAANIAESAFLAIDACFPDSVVGFVGYENIIKSEYVYYFLEATKLKISAYAPATAQKNINLETLENLVIPLCSLEEQGIIISEIENRLSICEKFEETIEQSLAKAEFLRQSILQRAFAGKLVSQDPNDEPSCKLLERIRLARENDNSKKTSAKGRTKK